MQAMIFAAGLGTRLRPLTDNTPKALVKVAGKPLLQHVLEKLKNAHVVINVHHFAQQIKDYLDDKANFSMDISVSDESACLLDTGGGIKHAAPLFQESTPILIHNVDIFSSVDLQTFYQESMMNVATLLVSKRETSRYLIFDDDNCLIGWENTKTGEIKGCADGSRYAFSGIHTFSPLLFKYFDLFPERFSIIDFYLSICKKEKIKCRIKDDLCILDVGKLDSLAEAEKFVINNY